MRPQLFIASIAASVFGLSCPINPPRPPAPSPSTPAPTPTPSASPTPPSCEPPAGAACREPGIGVDGYHRAAVDRAIEVVRGGHPTWFGAEVRTGSWVILGEHGEPLHQDTIPEHFHRAVIERLQEIGLCARPEADEIAVSHPADASYENYHTVIAGAGPRTAYGRGMFRATCDFAAGPGAPTPVPSTPPSAPPDPTPIAGCPTDLGIGKLEGRRHNAFTNPDGSRVFIVDATPKVCDRPYCAGVGLAGRECCSPGGGDGQWTECEAELLGVTSDGTPGVEWTISGTVRASERRDLTKLKVTLDPGQSAALEGCVPQRPTVCTAEIPVPW